MDAIVMACGDAANELLGFYQDKAYELEQSGQYFMAAIALASSAKKMVANSKYLTQSICRS